MDEQTITEMPKDLLEMLIMMMKDLLEDEKGLEGMAQNALDEFDKNENGVLELDEFTMCMSDLYKTMGKGTVSKEEIAKMFKEADTNHDDSVDKEEFIPLCKKLTLMIIKEMETQIAKL